MGKAKYFHQIGRKSMTRKKNVTGPFSRRPITTSSSSLTLSSSNIIKVVEWIESRSIMTATDFTFVGLVRPSKLLFPLSRRWNYFFNQTRPKILMDLWRIIKLFQIKFRSHPRKHNEHLYQKRIRIKKESVVDHSSRQIAN